MENKSSGNGLLATETTSKSEILGLDRDSLRVDGCEVRVLKQRDEVCLGCLLEGHDGGGLEAKVGLENDS